MVNIKLSQKDHLDILFEAMSSAFELNQYKFGKIEKFNGIDDGYMIVDINNKPPADIYGVLSLIDQTYGGDAFIDMYKRLVRKYDI